MEYLKNTMLGQQSLLSCFVFVEFDLIPFDGLLAGRINLFIVDGVGHGCRYKSHE